MPRKTRFFLSGVSVHVVQRGNNRQAVLFDAPDYRAYIDWLHAASLAHGCRIHAYCLMTNHIHLLLTPEERDSVSTALQAVGRRCIAGWSRRVGARIAEGDQGVPANRLAPG